mgnify:CR=1 FL=1
MTSVDGVFDGADGVRGIFPSHAPWQPEAGFVVEQPPAQLDDVWTRTVAKTRAAGSETAQ